MLPETKTVFLFSFLSNLSLCFLLSQKIKMFLCFNFSVLVFGRVGFFIFKNFIVWFFSLLLLLTIEWKQPSVLIKSVFIKFLDRFESVSRVLAVPTGGQTVADVIFFIVLWDSGSKVRKEQISCPKNSNLRGVAEAIGKISKTQPRH